MSPLTIFVCFLLGIPLTGWPYKLSRFSERLDAIGSTTNWSEVEPATWKVHLTRAVGIFFLILGGYGLGIE